MGRHYHHLTHTDRERLMRLVDEGGHTFQAMADAIGCHKSTISRELRRGRGTDGDYSALAAQKKATQRRKVSRHPRLLADPARRKAVASCLCRQWSPEQIEGRLLLEHPCLAVSDSTIYRAISAGMLDAGQCGTPRAKARLRHRGKRRRRNGAPKDGRGRIPIDHRIGERPAEADQRTEIGHWEGDTVLGKAGGPCLVALTDRKSGLEAGGKAGAKKARHFRLVAVRALKDEPVASITLDRGKEMAEHRAIAKSLDTTVYFCDPHHPWQRGTNENTNGLLRGYFPKGTDFTKVTDRQVQEVYDELNRRPRKRLDWLTPYEAYHNTTLHLI